VKRTIWWAPANPDWWVAVLFIAGSSGFALGSVPPYAAWAGFIGDGATYFVGSLFFTSAAFLQLLLSAGVVPRMPRPLAGVRWRTLVRAPHRPEWWAAIVQFGGTLLFNISTFAALDQSLSTVQAIRRVWTPDVFGSIAFLIASGLAYADVDQPWLGWRPKDLNWSVATLNMAGSIAFGISALAAQVLQTTGSLRNAQLANLGTFVGAIGFLVGAVLLIPDDARAQERPVAAET
jgi:hypothetical protein